FSGFGAGATLVADPAAVTDAYSGGSARGALLMRLPNGAPAGAKSITFSLVGEVPAGTTALIQVFGTREVQGYSEVVLPAYSGPTNTPGPSPTPTNTTTPTNTPTASPTATPTSTPIPGGNYALAFAGNQRLEGSAISGMNGNQTIELWVRPSAADQNGVLVASDTSFTSQGWALEMVNGQLTWWISPGTPVAHSQSLPANTWTHVAATFNGSQATLYVNGVAGTSVAIGAVTFGDGLFVGGHPSFNNFAGQLDELRLSNSVRYTGSFTPPSALFSLDGNTRALFGFDEGSGQTTSDRSGNGYSLTLGTTGGVDANDPSWVVSDLFPSGGGGGGGNSLRLFGSGPADIDRVKIPLLSAGVSLPVNVDNDFTIECWIKASATANPYGPCDSDMGWYFGHVLVDRDVFGSTDDYGDYGIAIMGGQIIAGVNNSNGEEHLCGNIPVTDGQWHHIAFTRNATTGQMSIFVDGQLAGQATGPTGRIDYRTGRTTSYPNSDPFLVLGAEKHDVAGSLYYTGLLDDLRISNIVRYTSNFTRPSAPHPNDANTAALYRFDEGSGTMIGDSATTPGGPCPGQLVPRDAGNSTEHWSNDSPFL
ncbi:MAG: LamG domain-containing protein, partial [Candidatus Viridilinea halotolerans]